MKIRRHFAIATVLAVLPLLALGGALVWWYAERQRLAFTQGLVDSAELLSLAVDREVGTTIAAAQALGLSADLDRGDHAAFYNQANALRALHDAWLSVALVEPSGRQVLNLAAPYGASLPSLADQPQIRAAIDMRQPKISNLVDGRATLTKVIAVNTPVLRDGRLAYVIGVTLKPQGLGDLLRLHELPASWQAVLIDGDNVIIAQATGGDGIIGQTPRHFMRPAAGAPPSGVVEGQRRSGEAAYLAYHRSPMTGWTTLIAAPVAAVRSSLSQALAMLGAGILALAGLAVAVGWAYGGRMEGLLAKAQASVASYLREREESEARFRELVAVAPVGIYVCNADGAITFCNDQAVRLWGRAPTLGDTEQRFCGSFRLYRADGAPLAHADTPVAAVLRTGESALDQEVIVEREDGSRRHVLANIVATRDPHGAIIGAVNAFIDVTDRKAAERRQALMMHELDHRAKNLLAVVQGLMRLTRADTVPDYLESVQARIAALARAHTLLAEGRWDGADLEALVRRELMPSARVEASRLAVAGPQVALNPSAVQPLAMALHELVTNAVKHGALSARQGHVDVTWRIDGQSLVLRWQEQGGPPAVPPARHGFGLTVLQQVVAYQLDGRVALDWAESGLSCTLSLPLAQVAGGSGRHGWSRPRPDPVATPAVA